MIDSKQYLLSRKPWDKPGFRHFELPGGFVLSCHEALQVRMAPDRGTVLLGHAWSCVETDGLSPLDAAAQCRTPEEIESLVAHWAGRWLLIREGRIYLDACGLLGCFFAQGACASSLSLLARHLGQKPVRPCLEHGFGMDYFPGPLTPRKGIRRLLPGQGLRLSDGSVFARPVLDPPPTASDAKRTEMVLALFNTLLRRFAADWHGPILLALTAGYDSRTLLSLLVQAGVDVETFTLDHANIRRGDLELPPQLAAAVGRPHRLILRSGPPDRRRFRDFDFHSAGMSADEDRNFYAWRQYPESATGPRTAVLRAGVWEAVRHYYSTLKTKSGWTFRRFDDPAEFAFAYLNVRYRPLMRQSLEEWMEWQRDKPSPADPADLFYVVQRAGCWLSSVEQGLDIVDGMDSLQLCNCRTILSLLAGYPAERRTRGGHQEQIIRAACPALLQFPFQGNPAKAHPVPAPPTGHASVWATGAKGVAALLARKRQTARTYLRCLGLRGTIRLLLDERK